MKSVDIGAVAPESLPDVSGMAFDTSLPREERIGSGNLIMITSLVIR